MWLSHNIVTNEKCMLLEFVIEPVETTAFNFIFIFTKNCTYDLTPMYTLSIVSVMITNSNKV